MLPRAARLTKADEFASVVKAGRRAGTRHLVVHLLSSDRGGCARAGFVVSTKVGNSVVRHRVTRRLRPLVGQRLEALPGGVDLVIRALPAAAAASSRTLARDLDDGIAAAARKAGLRTVGIQPAPASADRGGAS